LHIEQARAAGKTLASAQVGDARQLPFTDASADAVLLLGPLYHLVEQIDRLTALREGARCLRRGGVLFAAGISRFASTIDGLSRALLKQAEFQSLLRHDLATGQHRNLTDNPDYFTTAFFHRPDELRAELTGAGLSVDRVIGIEGPVWNPADLAHWASPSGLPILLEVLRAVESEPSLVGASAHLMAIARKA
jgi:SAM-dependent methyltransferase